jgi:predicted cation transporter
VNEPAGIAIAVVLLIAPLAVRWIERNLEIFCLGMGVVATVCAGGASRHTIREAAVEPLAITAAVIVASFIFKWTREAIDRGMAPLRARVARPILVAVSVFVLASLAGVITAIVSALVMVELIGLLRLGREVRTRVVVAGCFAIGLGAALTPVGEPLSALAASALKLGFTGLARLLGFYIVPGIVACAALAGYFARGDYHQSRPGPHVRETAGEILLMGARVFGFVAGLILISEAYAPLARRYLPGVSDAALYWGNTISAVLDNATLVALEVHGMTLERAREAIIALLVSGGMLVPGNIPNVVIAGSLRISSKQWAMVGLPIGFVMLGIYFAVLRFLRF